MQQQVTINIAVDVIKALSDKSLNGNIYFMDNSPFQSLRQGTENLCTLCKPGQILHWSIYPIDLQTPVVIKKIIFTQETECKNINNSASQIETFFEDDNPDLKVWTGIVPFMKIGHTYKYRLVLEMGKGVNNTMSIDTASLAFSYSTPTKNNLNTTDHE